MLLKNKNQTSIQDAIILAAGYGRRMEDLTQNTPKPLVNFFDRPLIEHILCKLQEVNVKNIHINHHYLGEQICNFIRDYKEKTTSNNYYLYKEEKLLGTGGSVKHIGNKITRLNQGACQGPVLVHNVDVIIPNKDLYEQFLNTWNDIDMDALLLLCPVEKMIGFEGGADYISDSREVNDRTLSCKRAKDDNMLLGEGKGYVFTGIHIFHPRILQHINHDIINLVDVFDHAERNGRLGFFAQDKEDVFHVGTKKSLFAAEEYLEKYHM